MSKVNVIRAWKDAEYFSGLSANELSAMPSNPAGEIKRLEAGGEADMATPGCTDTCTPVGCAMGQVV